MGCDDSEGNGTKKSCDIDAAYDDTMTDRFENMIMRLFIMRIGKSKSQTWRVVYGAFTPCLEKMDVPFISESSAAGNCEWGKLSVKRIVWASERDVILGIFKDLSSGMSLKTSFEKWGVNTDGMTFTVTWSDGSETQPEASEITFTGFDTSEPGDRTVTAKYGTVSTFFTVTVEPKSDKIRVTVAVYGDSRHDSDSDGRVHGLAMGGLTTWVSPSGWEADASPAAHATSASAPSPASRARLRPTATRSC